MNRLSISSKVFRRCDADNCIEARYVNSELFLISWSVNDLILVSVMIMRMTQVKDCLDSRLSIKNMSKLHYCLGKGVKKQPFNKCV